MKWIAGIEEELHAPLLKTSAYAAALAALLREHGFVATPSFVAFWSNKRAEKATSDNERQEYEM